MRRDLRRVFDFLARGDMAGARTEASPYGLAIFSDELPLRLDSNYLLVDTLPETVSAHDLVEEAGRLDRPAIMVRHERTGERLIAGFDTPGWRIHRGLVMLHQRRPERSADTGLVHEVTEEALRPARRQQLGSQPWASPEVMQQLLDAKLVIARAVEARFFAVHVDGQVVSYADLYTDGRTAQIEDVATLEGYRGRGYASAVVLRALQEARSAGCNLVFLVTDAQDWPKELYRRLGFGELGRYVQFIRPG